MDIEKNKSHTDLLLIFPNQLFSFENSKSLLDTYEKQVLSLDQTTLNSSNKEQLKKNILIYLVEDRLFFGHPKYTTAYHKQKILLHRATMQQYFLELIEYVQNTCQKKWQDHTWHVEYLEHDPAISLHELVQKNKLFQAHITDKKNIYSYEPADFLLEKSINKCANKISANISLFTNPGFLLTRPEVYLQLNLPQPSPDETSSIRTTKKTFLFTNFYIRQRKKFQILLEKDGSAVGGKWSFDSNNRKKLPKDHIPPKLADIKRCSLTLDILKKSYDHVKKTYPQNVGTLPKEATDFLYPITRQEALFWLEDFLHNRLQNFGIYEDAIHPDYHFLYHSVLTPSLNIGLITPDEILEKTIKYAQTTNIAINSLEGFIRQILGWREYMRAIYEVLGTHQRNANSLNQNRKLTSDWYTGTTGLKPVDDVILKVNKTAYAHHIERLMILGNILLLCEIDPEEVYYWFMEMFIDAYDWVMVPNVYGMSQYSDGGAIVTKPYISSSNYIRKMSNYKIEPWCDIWDGLYWRFIERNASVIKNNPRIGIMTAQLKKMNPERKKLIFELAEVFLKEKTK
jgi:deoxyribodipyrimidine photolyase-related protein